MQHPVPLVSYLFPFESCQAMFDLTLLLWLFLFGTGTWAERSYERGSVLASFRPPNGLSISLLRIGSFVFFLKLIMVLWVHIKLHVTEQYFFGKNNVKNGQKWLLWTF